MSFPLYQQIKINTTYEKLLIPIGTYDIKIAGSTLVESFNIPRNTKIKSLTINEYGCSLIIFISEIQGEAVLVYNRLNSEISFVRNVVNKKLIVNNKEIWLKYRSRKHIKKSETVGIEKVLENGVLRIKMYYDWNEKTYLEIKSNGLFERMGFEKVSINQISTLLVLKFENSAGELCLVYDLYENKPVKTLVERLTDSGISIKLCLDDTIQICLPNLYQGLTMNHYVGAMRNLHHSTVVQIDGDKYLGKIRYLSTTKNIVFEIFNPVIHTNTLLSISEIFDALLELRDDGLPPTSEFLIAENNEYKPIKAFNMNGQALAFYTNV